MGRIRASWVGVLVLGWFAFGHACGQGLTITEFMSQNRSILQDQDGDYPDWIEIYNATSDEVSLDGWFLTDDHDDLTKWKFPAVSLPAGGFLVVFASEKDRATAGSELHTSFALDDAGEYLALVAPDGTTVASEFSPLYPRQTMNVSCGHPFLTEDATLVGSGSSAKYLVPADATLLATWTAPGFDDATWGGGAMPLGFDTKSPPTYADQIQTDLGTAMARVNSTVYARFRFSAADPSVFDTWVLRIRYDDGFIAYLNGKEILRKNAPNTIAWNSRAEFINLDSLKRPITMGDEPFEFKPQSRVVRADG